MIQCSGFFLECTGDFVSARANYHNAVEIVPHSVKQVMYLSLYAVPGKTIEASGKINCLSSDNGFATACS